MAATTQVRLLVWSCEHAPQHMLDGQGSIDTQVLQIRPPCARMWETTSSSELRFPMRKVHWIGNLTVFDLTPQNSVSDHIV